MQGRHDSTAAETGLGLGSTLGSAAKVPGILREVESSCSWGILIGFCWHKTDATGSAPLPPLRALPTPSLFGCLLAHLLRMGATPVHTPCNHQSFKLIDRYPNTWDFAPSHRRSRRQAARRWDGAKSRL